VPASRAAAAAASRRSGTGLVHHRYRPVRPAIGRSSRARTSMFLRGRLWTLEYVYGTVLALQGGWCSVAGRCDDGVGGVGGASTMHVDESDRSTLHTCLRTQYACSAERTIGWVYRSGSYAHTRALWWCLWRLYCVL
jgi:hypothetical protein